MGLGLCGMLSLPAGRPRRHDCSVPPQPGARAPATAALHPGGPALGHPPGAAAAAAGGRSGGPLWLGQPTHLGPGAGGCAASSTNACSAMELNFLPRHCRHKPPRWSVTTYQILFLHACLDQVIDVALPSLSRPVEGVGAEDVGTTTTTRARTARARAWAPRRRWGTQPTASSCTVPMCHLPSCYGLQLSGTAHPGGHDCVLDRRQVSQPFACFLLNPKAVLTRM
jgi:hypothetical protein